MKKIFVVEQGEYSDYRVVGVFSTKENADRVAAYIGGEYDKPTVAEWGIDPCIKELNAGLVRFNVVMDYTGKTESVSESTGSYEFEGRLTVWKRTKAPAWRDRYINDAVSGTVWAKTKLHAVKIVNEFRVQQIAMGKMESHQEAK